MRRARYVVSTLAIILLYSCTAEKEPPLSVEQVRILAPLPGSTASVAYFVISNRTDTSATLLNVSSPQFSRVELHETSLSDGVSRMRRLAEVSLAGNAQTIFEAGGKHVMLLDPIENIHPGVAVTLNIQVDDMILLVSATLQERLSLN